MIAYFNGDFLEKDEITISPDDRGFLFADGLYEVIRSYRSKLFRAKEHIDRLSCGAANPDWQQMGGISLSDSFSILKSKLVSGDVRGNSPRDFSYTFFTLYLIIHQNFKDFL
jgi:hypothetical protein